MSKYTFVVLASAREEFLARLQELGLVDVTTSAWMPSDDDWALMTAISDREKAIDDLRDTKYKIRDGSTPVEGWQSQTDGVVSSLRGAEQRSNLFETYTTTKHRLAELETEIETEQKSADEVRELGNFDPAKLRELVANGVDAQWLFGAAEVSSPTNIPDRNAAQIENHIVELTAERAENQVVMEAVVVNVEALKTEIYELKSRLQFQKASASGQEAADGALVVMEAWARQSQENQVDTALAGHPEVLWVKAKPTPDDLTPVELANSKITRPFEFISEMYALPRYGTMDLTRWFAPFYMLFFGFCLSDAGYGALILLGGLFLAWKNRNTENSMRTIGKLSAWCGSAAVVFGFFAGSFFGLDIKQLAVFDGAQKMFLTSNSTFALALGLGVFQILFGMVLKVITTIRAFGVKYAWATIGWIMVIVSTILMLLPGALGINLKIPPVALWIPIGVGAFMMLFLNNPGKNPLVNFGGGLWNTYNDVTGFLSDALSYIRLFAIGLSGGVLAGVFNNLAVGLSPDIPIVGQIVTLLILLIGHGLNLFMSALSSMVHPLRLTFVEFYKNAGFEATTRIFEPLKKGKTN